MGRGARGPETFLTPYEVELVPSMLKEIDKVNPRFYQMACYRWIQANLRETAQADIYNGRNFAFMDGVQKLKSKHISANFRQENLVLKILLKKDLPEQMNVAMKGWH